MAMIKPIYDPKTKILGNVDGLETYLDGNHFGDVSMCKSMSNILGTDYRITEGDYGENLVNILQLNGLYTKWKFVYCWLWFRLVPYGDYAIKYFKNFKESSWE